MKKSPESSLNKNDVPDENKPVKHPKVGHVLEEAPILLSIAGYFVTNCLSITS